jgi:hypothetical protein
MSTECEQGWIGSDSLGLTSLSDPLIIQPWPSSLRLLSTSFSPQRRREITNQKITLCLCASVVNASRPRKAEPLSPPHLAHDIATAP